MARAAPGDVLPGLTVVPLPEDPLCGRIGRSIREGGGQELEREFLDLARNVELRRVLEKLHRRQPLDVVLERMSLFSYAGLQFARRRCLPYLLEVNAPLTREQAEHRRLELPGFAAAVEDALLSGADRVIAVSAAIRDFAVSRGADPGRVTVLPNAADALFRSPEPAAAESRRPYTVGFVGTLKSWHGLSELFAAFHRISGPVAGARLLIVGDGPERPRLEALAESLGISKNLEWAGEVPHCEVPRLLARMDVAAAPYPPIPGFYFSPLKIAEYMASGRAIVAGRIGQLAETLEHERTALLYRPGDTEGLAGCLLRLAGDEGLRKRLGSNALDASRRRSWQDNARTIVGLARAAAAELCP
jgi:glycosyltransferase involved in cell wall biosynthesis